MFTPPAQIIDARFQPLRPTIKMHRCERIISRVLYPQIQALALANKGPSIRRHINNMAHRDFPHRLVSLFHLLRQIINMLNTALVRNDVVFELRVPQTHINQLAHQIFVG